MSKSKLLFFVAFPKIYLQAMTFYLPRAVWLSKEGGLMKFLAQGTRQMDIYNIIITIVVVIIIIIMIIVVLGDLSWRMQRPRGMLSLVFSR